QHKGHIRAIALRLQTPRYETGHGFPRLEYPARRRVVRVAVLHRADRSLDDVVGCREIRFPNFQVHDALAFRLELPGARKHLEGALRPEPRHPLCESNRSAAHESES